MNIDIFNIFRISIRISQTEMSLSLGSTPGGRPGAPDYFRNQKGKSPMPLNHVLLWWSEFFSAGHNFTSISMKPEPVGQIANPEVSSAFAMNYYYIPKRGDGGKRPRIDPEKLKYEREAAFSKKYLNDSLSEASFEAML